MTNVVRLILISPLSLLHIFVVLGLRSVGLAALAWWQLAMLFVNCHVEVCCRIVALSIALVTLPIRMLTALQREAKLERLLGEMQTRLESLIWDKEEIEEQLQTALQNKDFIETLYQEIEEEHYQALARIHGLEDRLLELKEENMRLNKIQGKALWNCTTRRATEDVNARDAYSLGSEYGNPLHDISDYKSGLIPGDSWEIACEKRKSQQQEDVFKVAAGSYLVSPQASRDITVGEALERKRILALWRSLFSAFLSLVVSMIIWEAEDPCAPLVAALFTVVGMSLGSVLDFFSTIKNRPASSAVLLLSVNWFMLGALTTPTLPMIARMLTPKALRFSDQVLAWLGFPANC